VHYDVSSISICYCSTQGTKANTAMPNAGSLFSDEKAANTENVNPA
jgi:hypothetical protein